MSSDVGSRKAQFLFRFGTAEFDESRLELKVGGLLVDVQRKPLQILARLLATPGEAVNREVLFAEVWNNRATGDAVLANAISKLRTALGEQNEARLVTVPRLGFRLDGPIERIATGRQFGSSLNLRTGDPAPAREGYVLQRRLATTVSNETWLIQRPGSGERRVLKFALDGEELANLKREVTLNRVLHESVRDRQAFVRMLDWNFESEPFWIESEFAGRNLAEWAVERHGDTGAEALAGLSLPERLELVLRIGDAVAAAHDVGVLHKDLKPSNVLVSDVPHGLHVRLADFGSGHLADPDRLDALRITKLGLTVNPVMPTDSGTPLYVAPELLAGEAPGQRSDLYSFGVMAYQIMAGDLRRLMAPGWEREIDDPLLRADLATATDLEPARRFASVAEFLHRLRQLPQRRLDAEQAAEAASRHSAWLAQQAREKAQRPWVVAALVALLGGLGLSLLLFAGAQSARRQLASELAASSALNQLMREDLIGAANPALQGRADATVADALVRAAAQVDVKFSAQAPAVRAALHTALQAALSELSQTKEAVATGRKALQAYAAAPDSDPSAIQEVRVRLAVDLVQLSELDAASALVKDIEAMTGRHPMTPEFEARLLFAKSWLTGGEFSLQESLRQLERARDLIEPLDPAKVPWRDKILFALGDNYTMVGRHAEGEQVFRQLHAEQLRRLGARHARPAYTLVGLGRTLTNQGKLAEARAVFDSAIATLGDTLGAHHRMTLTARDQLAMVRLQEGQYAEAAEEWRQAQAGFAALLGEGSSYTITLATNRAEALYRGGKLREAESLLRESLRRVRAILPENSPQTQQIRYVLARVLLDLKQPAGVGLLLHGLQPDQLNLAHQETDWPERIARLSSRLQELCVSGVPCDE